MPRTATFMLIGAVLPALATGPSPSLASELRASTAAGRIILAQAAADPQPEQRQRGPGGGAGGGAERPAPGGLLPGAPRVDVPREPARPQAAPAVPGDRVPQQRLGAPEETRPGLRQQDPQPRANRDRGQEPVPRQTQDRDPPGRPEGARPPEAPSPRGPAPGNPNAPASSQTPRPQRDPPTLPPDSATPQREPANPARPLPERAAPQPGTTPPRPQAPAGAQSDRAGQPQQRPNQPQPGQPGTGAGQATPERPTPGQASPGQTSPAQPSPGQATPGQPTPARPTPGQPTPGQATPSQPAQGQNVPGRPPQTPPAPDRTQSQTPAQTPGQPNAVQPPAGQAAPNAATPPARPGAPGSMLPGALGGAAAGAAAGAAGAAAVGAGGTAPASVIPEVEPGRARAVGIEDLRRQRQERREGNATIFREPGRTIIRENNRLIIQRDEGQRFRDLGLPGDVERRGDEYRTVFARPDGVRIVTITDQEGRLIRRVRQRADGEELVIIDNTRRGGRGGRYADEIVVLERPALRIPRERYIVDAEQADEGLIYETLTAEPIERLPRAYSLDEVRYSPDLRARMRSVDVNTITFPSGSWTIGPDQARRLSVIAAAVGRAVQANPAEVFLIEGHTDAVGADVDNLSLSDRRAQSVAEALSRDFNVPPENLTTQGYGEQYLKVQTPGPSTENRRVTLRRITPLLNSQNQR